MWSSPKIRAIPSDVCIYGNIATMAVSYRPAHLCAEMTLTSAAELRTFLFP
jgi:hypothetical protein